MAESSNDRANRGANSRQTKASDKTSNARRELDEESTTILANNSKEVVDRSTEVLNKLANRASLLDNLTNGSANAGETKASKERGDRGAQLNKKTLSVGAGDFKDVLDLGGEVLDELVVALDVLANGSDDAADGHTDVGETEAGNKTGDFGGELDQQSAEVLVNDGEETLDLGAKVLDKVTDVGSGGDDGANGATETSQAEAGEEGGDFRAELDEQLLGVGASDAQDLVDRLADILDEVAAGDRRGSGGSRGDGGGGGRGGGSEVEGLGGLANNGQTASRGSSGRGGQDSEGSNESNLHFDMVENDSDRITKRMTEVGA